MIEHSEGSRVGPFLPDVELLFGQALLWGSPLAWSGLRGISCSTSMSFSRCQISIIVQSFFPLFLLPLPFTLQRHFSQQISCTPRFILASAFQRIWADTALHKYWLGQIKESQDEIHELLEEVKRAVRKQDWVPTICQVLRCKRNSCSWTKRLVEIMCAQ